MIVITPPTLFSPLSSESESTSDLGSESTDDSITSLEIKNAHYHRFLNAIHALQDEIQKARIIHPIAERPFHAPQLHLLQHFADHRPHLFRKKLRVDPEIFDCILEQIISHPIVFNHNQINHNFL